MINKDVLGYYFGISSRFYKKAVNNELEKYGLTTVQCGVIRILLHAGELTQCEIADMYYSDRATIGNVIMKLEEKNFIERKLSSIDRRSYVVSLTAKAREIAKEIEEASEKVAKKALNGMSDDEIQQFYSMLKKIIKNLKEDDRQETESTNI